MTSPEDALLAIYDRTIDDVHRYASRLTGGDPAGAEELVQDTYLGVLQRLRRGEQLDLTTGYLVVACRSRYIDQIRSGDRRRHREQTWTRVSSPAIDTFEHGDQDHAARRALQALPADQRLALVLRYVDDLSVPDVATQLGRSVRATESLLARARLALKALLGQEDPR